MSIFRKIIARIIGFFYNTTSFFAPIWTSKRLFKLFATPPKVTIRPKEESFLAQAIPDEYTLRDWGGMLYHWGETNRPYVLMSYGWGYNAGRWRHYVPALLEAGYRVIAYDPPGHGKAQKGTLTIPKNAALIHRIVTTFGPPKMVLAHSFGGGTTIEAFSELPSIYHPKRLVIMASFSKASWIFRNFQYILGLTERTYRLYVQHLEQVLGKQLKEFDLALKSQKLTRTASLIVHDPKDRVTHYRNANRYQTYMHNSHLLAAKGAGHHLGKATITEQILTFLIDGKVPNNTINHTNTLEANHDLVRYFAGIEFDLVDFPVKIP